jgi:hypothetical protein
VKVQNSTEHTDGNNWVQFDLSGNKTTVGSYGHSYYEKTAPYGGAGTGGAGSGGSGGGGMFGGGVGTTPVGDDDDGSVPCPTCYIKENSVEIPPPHLDGLDALLVGVPYSPQPSF